MNRFVIVNDEPINQDMSINEIVKTNTPRGWEPVFENAKNELGMISDILEEKGEYLPLKKNLFRAFSLTPLQKVRVVIFGQDPYHGYDNNGQPQAQGLSFSVSRGVTVPPSLRNIYKEIKRSYPNWEIPNHGCLDHWASQGVLLLNSSLTVMPRNPDSHSKSKLWLPFIRWVLVAIENVNPKCIYVLWGKKAEKMKKFISNKAIILESSHPSPFSARRGFEGCGHFHKINEYLDNPIQW